MLGLYLKRNDAQSNYLVTIELENLSYIYAMQTREAAFQMLEALSGKDETELLQQIQDNIAAGVGSGTLWDPKLGAIT